MNCFNIREIQTLLRSRYHPDRWDINEHHTLLHETALGLRLKLLNLSCISPNMLLSHEYGITATSLTRTQLYYYRIADSTESYLVFLFYIGLFNLKEFLVKTFTNLEFYGLYSFSFDLTANLSSYQGHLSCLPSQNSNL